MSQDSMLIAYTLRLADNALILAQRMVELVAAEPELEEELANANFALDYIGQARMFYTRAGHLEGRGRSEDDFAFMRDEHEFRNLLLLEQPNGHFGDALVRQFLFEAFYVHQLEALTRCSDAGLVEIAARAVKEVTYHRRHSAKWLIRLGDGTELSHDRAQASLDDVWRYTGEMFAADAIDMALQENYDGPDLAAIQTLWLQDVSETVAEATLKLPEDEWMASGGKQGKHSEHLGFLLAEMQYLQRSFPGATW
jgi:ring-1,2-phenylacetyl-CoA epoxidase subunit PaaC